MLNKISELRCAKKMSQSALAKAVQISRTHLSDIENDKANPSIDIAQRISRVLGTKLEHIFFNNNVV